jgi:hypothetical protein
MSRMVCIFILVLFCESIKPSMEAKLHFGVDMILTQSITIIRMLSPFVHDPVNILNFSARFSSALSSIYLKTMTANEN